MCQNFHKKWINYRITKLLQLVLAMSRPMFAANITLTSGATHVGGFALLLHLSFAPMWGFGMRSPRCTSHSAGMSYQFAFLDCRLAFGGT